MRWNAGIDVGVLRARREGRRAASRDARASAARILPDTMTNRNFYRTKSKYRTDAAHKVF